MVKKKMMSSLALSNSGRHKNFRSTDKRTLFPLTDGFAMYWLATK